MAPFRSFLVESLYNLIRPQQQRRRDRKPERLRGLEVDRQLELGRLYLSFAKTPSGAK
jgi:hypothetical protein